MRGSEWPRKAEVISATQSPSLRSQPLLSALTYLVAAE